MKRALASISVLLRAPLAGLSTASATKPNIVFIITDDQG